ncbi:MAG TPA: flagellar hook-basal body complex protein FliE [Solirubrobacteraceae bacterium]|nr:flagellar hook-basal body complex protein FliE [Solirubrobacteraceae bacterium]
MTVLPIGAVGGELSLSHLSGLGGSQATPAGASKAQGAASGLSLSNTEGPGSVEGPGSIEGAGGVERAGGIEGTGGIEGAGGAEAAGGASGEGGFGSALGSAISSLEQTQNNASNASQALATGTVSDPESAVVTVEEAQLAMQLASQIRTKATEAAQQIFQTQV